MSTKNKMGVWGSIYHFFSTPSKARTIKLIEYFLLLLAALVMFVVWIFERYTS